MFDLPRGSGDEGKKVRVHNHTHGTVIQMLARDGDD